MMLALLTPSRSAFALACAVLICSGFYVWGNSLSHRLSQTQTKLAATQKELLDERVSSAMVRSALSTQIVTLHDIAARETETEKDRLSIMSTCGTKIVQPGEIVDDKTSRAVVDHINRSLE